MYQLETVIKKVTYYNEENGYSVVKDESGRAFVGYLMFHPKHLIDLPVVVRCEKKKTKYGIQYHFLEIEHNIPPLFHFLTHIIKGVQKKAAIELANKYKTISKLEEELENNEEKILEIKGIGKKSLQKLKEGIKAERDLYALAEFLLPYSVSPKIIKKLYNKFQGKSVIEELKKEPYKTLTSVKGIGFKKADKIVLKAKLAKKNSIYRAKAGIEFIFSSIMNDCGNSVLKKSKAKEEFFNLFKDDFEESMFEKAFEELIKEQTLFLVNKKEEICSFTSVYHIENFIYEYVKERSFSFIDESDILQNGLIEAHIKAYENATGIQFDEKQKEAIKNFLTSDSSLYIIAGYAGTGKTTTTKAIISFLKSLGKKVVGCALSGAAANRLEIVSGMKSYTIHSLLGYRRGKDEDRESDSVFRYNSKNKLKYDLIVLDEASMVNASLVFHLLKAVDPKRTKVLMLGDDAQLPPIGWGEVFSDLLSSSKVKKTKLTRIYRQSDDKVITYFASKIRKGEIPKGYTEKRYSDFNFVQFNIYKKGFRELPANEKKIIREENNLKIRNFILKGYQKSRSDILKNIFLYKEGGDKTKLRGYISRIQLISPLKNGILGTLEMNSQIKRILNPINYMKDREGCDYIRVRMKSGIMKEFSRFDKVIHLKNLDMFCTDISIKELGISAEEAMVSSSTQRIYNGQVGVITDFFTLTDEDEEDTLIEVYYPNEDYFVYYSKEDFYNEYIDLSYAITIHKSQGQEYQSVIIPVTMSHYHMLNSKLLYTAITRAKDKVILAGERKAFEIGVRKMEEIKRQTVLKTLIEDEFIKLQGQEGENNEKTFDITDSIFEFELR